MLKEKRYGHLHLPFIFSASLICILIIWGLHIFLTYAFYSGLRAPEGRLPLFLVWAGVGASAISLVVQFCCAVEACLPPIALFAINAVVAAGLISVEVYFWFVDGGQVSPLVCGLSSTKHTGCEYNALVLIEVAFMGLLTILTIYAAVLGLVKISWRSSEISSPIHAQEVQVLLQEGRSSTNSIGHQLSPLKSPHMTSTEAPNSTLPDRLTRVSRGPSLESYNDYAATGGDMPSTDPFDSKLQRLGLRRYSYFDNHGSQTDCVIAAIANLMGYNHVSELYDKLVSMQSLFGITKTMRRDELYEKAIYYLLKQFTDDKIFNELVEKRQVLKSVGTRYSPLLSSDWNLNRLGVVYNRTLDVGDCIILERTSAGTWDVAEAQMDELSPRTPGSKLDDFTQTATSTVLVFAIYAGEDASRSAITREARSMQESYRTISMTTSLSTLNGARAASPVITHVSLAPSTISNIVSSAENSRQHHVQSQHYLPTSPFREAHPRFSAHYPSPNLNDERLSMLYDYDRSRADAISAEYHRLTEEFASASSQDDQLASQSLTYVGSEHGVQLAEKMQVIAARVLGLREAALQGFGHVLADDETEARGREEVARWVGIVEGLEREVSRRKELLGTANQTLAYPQQAWPQQQQRTQVISKFREVDLAQPETNRSELDDDSARLRTFAAKIVARSDYRPLRQQEAELDHGGQGKWRGEMDQEGPKPLNVRRRPGSTLATGYMDAARPQLAKGGREFTVFS